MHILSGNQSASTDRQVERERDVFFLNFVIFLALRTRLRIPRFRDEMSLSDCITLQTAFAQMESKAKAFWFSEGRTKV